jgi:phenylacetate-coenzyme A ligase PaaK-like adenylate-forming protein
MPVLTLKAELVPSMGEGQSKEMKRCIREKLKIRTNLTFEVEVVKPGELPRYSLKSARFKDMTRR